MDLTEMYNFSLKIAGGKRGVYWQNGSAMKKRNAEILRSKRPSLEDSRRQERDLLAEWQCYEEEKCRDPEEQEAKPRHRFNLFQGLMKGW